MKGDTKMRIVRKIIVNDKEIKACETVVNLFIKAFPDDETLEDAIDSQGCITLDDLDSIIKTGSLKIKTDYYDYITVTATKEEKEACKVVYNLLVGLDEATDIWTFNIFYQNNIINIIRCTEIVDDFGNVFQIVKEEE